MRIISGTLRGKILPSPLSADTRPTSDRAREVIFNVLTHKILPCASFTTAFQGLSILDVFAGTGAFGFEALSRGAAHATFIESNVQAARSIQQYADLARLPAQVLCQNAGTLGRAPRPYDLIFCDPPYNKGLLKSALESLLSQGWCRSGTYLVLEAHREESLSFLDDSPCVRQAQKKVGLAQVVFLQIPILETLSPL